MSLGDGYTVRIPDTTIEGSDAVADYVEEHGRQLRFDSREAVESLAATLTAAGSARVVLQRSAPQDPSDVDGYLVLKPERRTDEPIETSNGGLTFETSAAQYGALGEALLTSPVRNPPAIVAFAKRDLDLAAAPQVTIDTTPDPVSARPREGGRERRWQPDCRAAVSAHPDGPTLREYLIEVKTGNGSLLRDQLAVMRAVTDAVPAVVARVSIEELPDRYTVRWRSVEAGSGDLRLESPRLRQRDLREYE